MSKYEPLSQFLSGRAEAEIPLTFEEIERIIGARLPPRSQLRREWWSNNPDNNVMTRAWLSAGFHTERVDIAARRVVFRRREGLRRPAGGANPPMGVIDRLRAALAGTVTIAPGVDICEPTGEVWDAER